jgi:hypothetical protein
VAVRCRPFAALLREHGVPFYLKVDIEGHDHHCLNALDPADLPRYVSCEAEHLDYLFLLRGKGYNAFKCIRQHTFTRLRADHPHLRPPSLAERLRSGLRRLPGARPLLRPPLRLARALRDRLRPRGESSGGWHFKLGSSGPFGEDTDAAWGSLEEVAYEWLNYQLHIGRVGRPTMERDWFDFHATHLPEAPPAWT